MLHKLIKITTRQSKRLGRGIGSGKGGHTVGRGTKGHTSREGGTIPLWFEGGQLPLIKRLPYWRGKFHFKSLAAETVLVQVAKLEKMKGQDITPETLVAAKIIKDVHSPVKIVGTAQLTSVGQVRGVALSASAQSAIEAAGGKIV